MAPSKLKEWFPWTTAPVIINGPMIGVACPALASEVSKAGGIGMQHQLISCFFFLSALFLRRFVLINLLQKV